MLNIDALVILQRSDVLHLAAHPERFEGVKLLFTDPGILDDAVSAGITRYEFRRLDVERDMQARAFTESKMRALAIDLRLSALRRELFEGTVLDGWDVGLFQHTLTRLLIARETGRAIEHSFAERRLGVLRPSNPIQHYFDSFPVTDLVARDPARWCVVDHYDGARLYNAHAYAFGFDTPAIAAMAAERPVDALTHVPTCFYDKGRIEDELTLHYPHTIDLPGMIWDVPIRRGRVLFQRLEALPAPSPAVELYAERARQALREMLSDLLPQPAARELQIDSWTQRCRLQAINYTGLLDALQGHSPDVVVSDHDTGNNGPLFSLADALGSSITVLPHSAHPASLLPHARRVTAIERAGFGTRARTVLGQAVTMRSVRWKAAPETRAPERVRTVSLLLNTSYTEGLSYYDLLGLVAFYKSLAALCEQADVELAVRLKPNAAALSVMSGALGVTPKRLYANLIEPLDELAQRSQVCIAYGEPSTGMMAFLDTGAYVFNASEAMWPMYLEACPPLVADGLVPSLRLNECLQVLHRLIHQPEHFRSVRAAQATAMVRLGADAHDTLFARSSTAPQAVSSPVSSSY